MNAKIKPIFIALLGFFLINLVIAAENNKSARIPKIVTNKVSGNYFEVVQSLRSAILGKGINIAHELHASDMLQRTGPAYGYKKSVYSHAQILEFCSAKLSQELSRADPDNIVVCPFTIGIYSLVTEPKIVHISYQVPNGKPGSEKVIKKIEELLASIVEDATW